MAYWPTREKVRVWEENFKAIRRAIDAGVELEFKAEPESLHMEAVRVRDALYSAAFFPDELEGRYKDLKKEVVVRVVPPDTIMIVPRAKKGEGKTKAPTLKEFDDERLFFRELSKYEGEIFMLEFRPGPGFDLEAFAARVLALGWKIEPDWIEPLEDGRVRASAERASRSESEIEKDFSIEGILGRHGYSRREGDA